MALKFTPYEPIIGRLRAGSNYKAEGSLREITHISPSLLNKVTVDDNTMDTTRLVREQLFAKDSFPYFADTAKIPKEGRKASTQVLDDIKQRLNRLGNSNPDRPHCEVQALTFSVSPGKPRSVSKLLAKDSLWLDTQKQRLNAKNLSMFVLPQSETSFTKTQDATSIFQNMTEAQIRVFLINNPKARSLVNERVEQLVSRAVVPSPELTTIVQEAKLSIRQEIEEAYGQKFKIAVANWHRCNPYYPSSFFAAPLSNANFLRLISSNPEVQELWGDMCTSILGEYKDMIKRSYTRSLHTIEAENRMWLEAQIEAVRKATGDLFDVERVLKDMPQGPIKEAIEHIFDAPMPKVDQNPHLAAVAMKVKFQNSKVCAERGGGKGGHGGGIKHSAERMVVESADDVLDYHEKRRIDDERHDGDSGRETKRRKADAGLNVVSQ